MKKLTFIIIAIYFAINVNAAYVKNVPVELKQPDGTIIHCFITGDEFHRRVHDRDNYTVVQDPVSGFYVYALLRGEALVSSQYIVGKIDPTQFALEPNIDIPFRKMEETRSKSIKSNKSLNEISSKGTINTIVISIRFSDQSPTTLKLSDYEDKFNSTSLISLKSYFLEASNNQLNVLSDFYPQPQNQTIFEYQDLRPRAYYIPYNAITNPLGYKDAEYYEREQNLIKSSIENVKNQIIGSQINFDINNDGFIDNLIIILQGSADTWGSILWPMSIYLNSPQIAIGNKLVDHYNKQLSSMLNVSVICHEFFHALGAPDLYHYSYDSFDPVGEWDIMGYGSAVHMTAYMKWKYGKWFDAIPEITQPGTYTLQPVSKSSNACYKIPCPDNPSEYIMVEYRKKEGLLESGLPSNYNDGLIIYRINSQGLWGNASGPPDEIYIYRVGGDIFQNGDISTAGFSSNLSRTNFNSDSNPTCFLSNGKKGWIDISDISATGAQISFKVNYASPLYGPVNLTASKTNNQVLLKWNSPQKKNNILLGYNVYLEGINSPMNSTLITDTTYQTQIPGLKATYAFKVTAKYQQGESDPVICNFISFYTPSVKDSLALVALYNQCNGLNWTRKANWLSGPISSWEGVAVENSRVVKLDLGDESRPSVGLTGQIPAEISDLTEIKFLSFWQNQLTGILAESWSTLVNLQVLVLSVNHLSGTLPKSWSTLVNLQRLELLANNFTGTLPESWSSLINLQSLWLNDNQLTGTLPASWASMVNLQKLWLSYNQLTGTLPDSWSALVNLNGLNLFNNQLTETLPSSWSSFVKMEQLALNNNYFTGRIPDSWVSFKELQYLGFDGNQISGFPFLSASPKLNYLSVYSNKLDFGDLEPYIGVPKNGFIYAPQALVGKSDNLVKNIGEEFNISVSVGGKNNKYQWYKVDKGEIQGATASEYIIPVISSNDGGIYFCEIKNSVATDLILQSQPIKLKVNNLTIVEPTNIGKDILIYPNPTKGQIHIQLNKNDQLNNVISVYNKSGEIIIKTEVNTNLVNLNLAGNPAGMYFIKFNNESQIVKIILE